MCRKLDLFYRSNRGAGALILLSYVSLLPERYRSGRLDSLVVSLVMKKQVENFLVGKLSSVAGPILYPAQWN
jgi:hypothetical protein